MQRRKLLKMAAGLAAAPMMATAMADERRSGLTFVLVHGAWHGGWCWAPLARELAAKGHRVTTPTLTGLGERAHLLSPSIDLGTHIMDVVNHIDAEELNNIVLVGHSYGGFVIRGVSEKRAETISSIVYLDAFVPNDGEAVINYTPKERAQMIRDTIARDPAGAAPPPNAAAFGIKDTRQIEWVNRRMTPHPLRTYLQPLALTARADSIRSRSYIACLSPRLDVLDSTRDRIRADSSWRYLELQHGHDVMATAPELLAETLISLV
jgi:pimeloyl-ACP methyl ester carboxylesterase